MGGYHASQIYPRSDHPLNAKGRERLGKEGREEKKVKWGASGKKTAAFRKAGSD